jgi:nucleotide-binding universal stress UspA family protein
MPPIPDSCVFDHQVEEQTMLPIRTILHPTDFSERSRLAFELACSLARDYGARLILAHVVELPMPAVAEGVMMVPITIDPEPLRKRLEKLRPAAQTVITEHKLLEGNPAAEILRLAQETECDLIVLGTHGRTGIGRLLMGSVAEQIVREAPCPVITVKTPHEKTSPTAKPAATAQNEMNLTTVATFDDVEEAEMAKNALAAEGVPAHVNGEASAALWPRNQAFPTEIQVPAIHADHARKILGEISRRRARQTSR